MLVDMPVTGTIRSLELKTCRVAMLDIVWDNVIHGPAAFVDRFGESVPVKRAARSRINRNLIICKL